MTESLPIAFLPGASGNTSFWRPVAERLAGRTAIHVGYPAFGGVPPHPEVRSLSDLYRHVFASLPPRFDLVAQSMGGVLAARKAIEEPERVRRLVLTTTSGGVDTVRLGAVDWRAGRAAWQGNAPDWFVDDRTDLTEHLATLQAPTLLIFGDEDPISPVAVGEFLRDRIPASRLVVLRGGTHDLALERPDEVATLIAAHLDA